MPNYFYKILDKKGNLQKGKISAGSKEEVANQIKKKDWFVAEMREEKTAMLGISLFEKKESFSGFERINFTDHLAALIKAGTPIREALEAYAEGEDKKLLIIDSLVRDIEQGKKLSKAMTAYPKVFSSFYISLVQAGELAGNLDETLEYLANELRREYEFVQKVKSAMFYPALVCSVSFAVVSLIVTVVIPKIAEVTKSLGGNMPLTTRIVATVSEFLAKFGSLLILLIIGLLCAVIYLFKNKKTKHKISPYLLKLPLVGKIIKKYILARFLRIIGSCIKYGIPLTLAFSAAEEVVGNMRYKEACVRLGKKILQGASLSNGLAEEGIELFPAVIVRSLRGAEKTGGIDATFARLSIQYEIEVDRDLKRITELIEPVLVIFLGLIVAVIAISVIAPIYQMTSKIK